MMKVNKDLIQAVREGNLREVTALVDGQSDSSGLSGGYPLLRLAVEMNHSAIVRLLLDRGCPVSTSAPVAESLLHLAVRNGNLAILEMLLKEGADVNEKNKNGETPIAVAVRQRCLPMVELFLQYEKVTAANEPIPDGALHHAARNGFREVVEMILNKGAHVNKKNMAGQTPLALAAERGHFLTAQLLLKRGADINAKDGEGRTPLHLAAFNKYEGRNRGYTWDDCLEEQGMESAVEDEVEGVIRLEIAQLLLRKGAHVDAQTNQGSTALHIAIRRRFYSLVDLLLSYNADVNIANKKGITALSVAVQEQYEDLCKLLLEKGADVNARAKNGRTALHVAVRHQNQEIVQLLLKKGALVDRDGEFSSEVLNRGSNLRLMETLLDAGADVDYSPYYGITALHWRSHKGDATAVATLLDHGADMNIKCDKSYTALDWLHYDGDAECFNEDGSVNDTDTRDVLLRHQAKLEAIGLHVEKSQFSDRYEGTLKEFRESYQEEVKNLKSEFIVGTTVSYYDVLTNDVSCVAKYLYDENVVQAAESEEYKSKFPAYASLIRSQFRKGSAKKQLLKSAKEAMDGLINSAEVCAEKILDDLSENDLDVLKKIKKLLHK